MKFRRAFGALAIAAFLTVPTLGQEKEQAQQQRKLSNDERRDYTAVNELVDAVIAGKQAAPADLKLKFQHHFLKSAKNVYVPYIVEISGGKFSSFPVTMYVRAVQKPAEGATPAANPAAKPGDAPPDWPFADVYFLTEKNITTSGDVNEVGRALELPPGEYTLYIAMRERQPRDKKQGPPKAVAIAQPLSVPDMNKGLTTSSVILAKGLDPAPEQLTGQQQLEQPFTISGYKVTPSFSPTVPQAGELLFVFFIYNEGVAASGKPDLDVEYNFFRAAEDKPFTRLATQSFNATTLPGQFDLNVGHQVFVGRVLDDRATPIPGAMVSVVGRATAAATTDRNGRYTLRELPYGPYILSVHSRGFYKSRARTVQLTTAKVSIPEIQLARAAGQKIPAVEAVPVASAPVVQTTQLAGFSLDAATQPAAPSATGHEQPSTADSGETDHSEAGETAWRLRHLPRSILKDVATDSIWTDKAEMEPGNWWGEGYGAMLPIAFFSDLPLSGQLNLMTIESFHRPGEIFAAHAPRSVAFVSVNTQAAGGAWSMQGAMTQGDLSSWIVAGSYKSIESTNHAYELGLSYSTQRYDGANAAALSAIRDSARNVGSVYGYDEWTVSPRLVFGYGTGYARYDYLGGPGIWSPRLSVTVPLDGFRVKALASQRALVPGAEEFAPSVTGVWLPPERTFSSLARDGRFTAEQTRHLQLSVERDLAAGVTVSLRGFDQRTSDQLIEIFDAAPGHAPTQLGHYYVATAGNIEARGWGVGMTQEVPGYVRGRIEYSVASAYWDPASDTSMMRAVRSLPLNATEKVHDLQTTVEATIPQTATRLYAMYRVNTAFWNEEPDAYMRSSANARFNFRVNQSLPFLRFSNADWEALVDVRNIFREGGFESSIYDEALAIRAPKRIVGGLLVKF